MTDLSKLSLPELAGRAYIPDYHGQSDAAFAELVRRDTREAALVRAARAVAMDHVTVFRSAKFDDLHAALAAYPENGNG